jgi:diguanylate cyclase (GGDEF)-like protein/PAS domain S-box-containing protein
MAGVSHRVVVSRSGAYAATLFVVYAAYLLFRGQSLRISLELLTSSEWVATVLSLCVGALALVRYYSQREITFLFIGTGFIVNGLLGAGHAGITSAYPISSISLHSLQHIAWSWYASRLFLPVLLWLSWIFWWREQKSGRDPRITDRTVYWTVVATALVLFALFDVASLRNSLPRSELFIHVKNFLPSFFFLLSIAGYYRKGKWKSDSFEHWLILGMILGLMGELMLTSFARWSHDVNFTLAYILRAACHLCAFIGLLFNMQRLFSESLLHRELALKNIILATQQETSQDAILIVDDNDNILSYNRHFVDLLAIPEEMIRNGDDRPVLAYAAGQMANPEEFVAGVKALYGNKTKTSIDEIHLKDGTIIDRYSAPMIGADGEYYGRAWYLRDVTLKKQNERMMRESEEKFRSLIEQSLVGIAMIEEGRFSYINSKFAEIFGFSIDEVLRLEPAHTAVDEDRAIITGVMRTRLAGEEEEGKFTFRGRHKFGTVVNVEGRCARMNFGGKIALMLIIMDITERIRAELEVQTLQARLREQAIRDPLTGLFNRRYLDEVIISEMARAERGGYPLSLVMCDIDHFKAVNDTYGHLAGDEVLRAFSRLIKQYSRGGDIICRYGGEEFLLVLPGMSRERAVERAEQLRLAFAAALMAHDATIMRATASFGVASFPENGHEIDGLITAADKALYTAKQAGRNRVMKSVA